MDRKRVLQFYNRLKFRQEDFLDLMKFKVEEILLISPLYDAFVIEQDGGLSEKLFGEYHQLNLSTPPVVSYAPNGPEALKLLEEKRFDLVASMMRTGSIPPLELAEKVKQKHPGLPFVLLLNHPSDLHLLESKQKPLRNVDDIFFWSGDSKLFLALVKSVEDRQNIENDARAGLVRVILLIEDSITYYSRFLPLLYTEIMRLTRTLISEEVTEADKRLRMRLRPKLILARNFEEAEKVYREYRDNLLCVISDVEYERGGRLESGAGLEFMRMLRREGCNAPLLLHSLNRSVAGQAHDLDVTFLDKNSAHLHEELRSFMIEQLGFGEFVFRTGDGREIGRAGTIENFIRALTWVPEESLIYHARNNHFSAWLLAHGQVRMAKVMEPVKVEDFQDIASLRTYLLDCFNLIKSLRNQGRVVAIEDLHTLGDGQVLRLAPGSLGGKGRGLAFLNSIVASTDLQEHFPDLTLRVPLTAIVGTDEFDRFLERNQIGREILTMSDDEIRRRFLNGMLSFDLRNKLTWFLERFKGPLAVRSSGLLEDSQAYPFAGVYETYMIPNMAESVHQRVEQVMAAIRLVYSSMFLEDARNYLGGVQARLEDEKMAVVIQEVVGRRHEDCFYPDLAGVAQSYNFYPIGPMSHDDGIASIALGLGKTAVEGANTVRFSPRHTDIEILSPRDTVAASQKTFWAIDLHQHGDNPDPGMPPSLLRLGIADAQRHGTLALAGSVYDYENDMLVDDLTMSGMKVITFANVLKYGAFPLARALRELLSLGELSLGVPVEIEFAVSANGGTPAFNLLQIRPMSLNEQLVDVPEQERGAGAGAFVYSAKSMGNGCARELRDVIYVDGENFDSTRSLEIKQELQELNRKFQDVASGYLLIGPGRWGSRDRFLGVPVNWGDISRARAIVEADLKDFRIEASQGTHFLHNLVAMNIPYLKVDFDGANSWIDWDFIKGLELVWKGRFCVHVRTALPLEVKVDGRTGRAAAFKPGFDTER